ncbi:hypothetical protein [Eoetvoesiella caeni]
MNFNFLPQSHSVNELLEACVAALEHLPDLDKSKLGSAMKAFETFAVTTAWSAEDVDPNNELFLSKEDKDQVLEDFIDGYEVRESDIQALDSAALSLLKERIRNEGKPCEPGSDYWVSKTSDGTWGVFDMVDSTWYFPQEEGEENTELNASVLALELSEPKQ